MTNPTNPNDRGNTSNAANRGDVRSPDPQRAAVDQEDAARQDQVRRDHDALEASQRRVDASVPADVRDTPVQQTNAGRQAPDDVASSSRNADAARQNADAARESARRVEESAPDGLDRR